MSRVIKTHSAAGYDEYCVRKTGEVFRQNRFQWPAEAAPAQNGAKRLTAGDPELDRKIAATPDGMAFWSGTGPDGALCEECASFSTTGVLLGFCTQNTAQRKSQGEKSASGKNAPKPIPFYALTRSCKYFRAK
jgi:hypothetical protein